LDFIRLTLRLGPGDDVPCRLRHRDIDHPTFEQDAGVTLGHGFIEGFDEPPAFRNLPGCRAVKPVGGLDLRWVKLSSVPSAVATLEARGCRVLL